MLTCAAAVTVAPSIKSSGVMPRSLMQGPQTWMVPRQKYDVIHYIREAYLKPHNPGQYREVDADYLAGLPSGSSRGPETP